MVPEFTKCHVAHRRAYGLAQMCAWIMLSGPRVHTVSRGSHLTLSPFKFLSTHFWDQTMEAWAVFQLLGHYSPCGKYSMTLLVKKKKVTKVLWDIKSWNFIFFLPVFQIWLEGVIKRGDFQQLWPSTKQTPTFFENNRSSKHLILLKKYFQTLTFISLWFCVTLTKTILCWKAFIE